MRNISGLVPLSKRGGKTTDLEIDVGFHLANETEVALIRLPQHFRVLSSAVLGGGLISTDKLVVMEVRRDYDNPSPQTDLLAVCREMDLGEDVVGFMTAARIRKVLTVREAEVNGTRAVTVVTAGLTNMVVAGEPLSHSVNGDIYKHNTINIISVMSEPLNMAGMINAVITLTEAKTAALMDLGIRATGTTTDAIAVCCPPGEGRQYAGTATEVGLAMARATRSAVRESLIKNGSDSYN